MFLAMQENFMADNFATALAHPALAVHDITHLEGGDLADREPREKTEHDREAVPLAVPVVGDDRQQPLPFDLRQNLGLLHPENLIQSGYPSENITFSDLPEVVRNQNAKDPAGSSENLRKCRFPYLHSWYVCFFGFFVRCTLSNRHSGRGLPRPVMTQAVL